MTTQSGAPGSELILEPAPSAEEAALQQRLRIAALQRDLAQIERERRESEAYTARFLPPEGSTTLADQAGYTAELVAYQALRRCAARVAATINGLEGLPPGCTILIVDDLAMAAGDFQRIQTDLQLDLFAEAFDAAEASLGQPDNAPLGGGAGVEDLGVPGGLAAASSVAGLLADLLGYLRTDFTLSGRAVTLPDEALRACVAGRLTVGAPRLLGAGLFTDSPLLTKLRALARRRFELQRQSELLAARLPEQERAVADLRALREALTAQLDQPAAGEQPAGLPPSIAQVEERLAEAAGALGRTRHATAGWAAVGQRFDEFLAAAVTPRDGQQGPPLLTALQHEQVRQGGVTHLLTLRVVSSGGETITRKGLFAFGRIAFLGGCAVTFTLAEVGGAIVAADTCTSLVRLDYPLWGGRATAEPVGGMS